VPTPFNATIFPTDRDEDDEPDEPITDLEVRRFHRRFGDLGVSFDQLMTASRAGTLDAYAADINNGREDPLNITRAVRRYRTILARLDDAGRCVDFVRQATPDEPETCGVERWRRCCRGTVNDLEQVLLCAAHENLGVYPPFRSADGRATNSFRVRSLPLRRVVRSRTGDVSGGARWGRPDAPWRPSADGAPRPPRSAWSAVAEVGRWAAAVGDGRRGGGRAARRRGGAAAAAAAVAVEGPPRPTVATASRTTDSETVVPFYFEEQYEEMALVLDDPFVAWCKEFLFYSAGCVEFCCSTLFAGSALCDVNSSPDFCF